MTMHQQAAIASRQEGFSQFQYFRDMGLRWHNFSIGGNDDVVKIYDPARMRAKGLEGIDLRAIGIYERQDMGVVFDGVAGKLIDPAN